MVGRKRKEKPLANNLEQDRSVQKTASTGTPSSAQGWAPHAVDVLGVFLLYTPYLFSDQQRSFLYPLFGSSPVNSLARDVYLWPTLAGVIFSLTLRSANRQVGWQTWWILEGVWYIASEGIVRVGARWWTDMGLRKGVWTALAMVTGPPAFARACWRLGLISDLRTVNGPTSLFATFVGALGLATVLEMQSPRGTKHVLSLSTYIHSVSEAALIFGLVLVLLALVPASQRLINPPNTSLRLQSRPAYVIILAATSFAFLLSNYHSPRCSLSPVCPFFLVIPPRANAPRLLASSRSVTGRIVVGEATVGGVQVRYLRADHSLLGGLWIGSAREQVTKKEKEVKGRELEEKVIRRAESVYSTFILQELVRMTRPVDQKVEKQETALVIGLGAGLVARSLEQHGIVTSIVEIDPVVYQYAQDYFGVNNVRGQITLQDAIAFLQERRGQEGYDYIIHDVFTGGTVPPSLFTLEAWSLVKRALAPDGLVAINFAGVTDSRASSLVLSTILNAFHRCIALSDGDISKSRSKLSNLVLFCSASREITLRDPVPSDYLAWPSPDLRKWILDDLTKYVVDLKGLVKVDGEVLSGRKGEIELATLQEASAELHWALMNDVLPQEVWELY